MTSRVMILIFWILIYELSNEITFFNHFVKWLMLSPSIWFYETRLRGVTNCFTMQLYSERVHLLFYHLEQCSKICYRKYFKITCRLNIIPTINLKKRNEYQLIYYVSFFTQREVAKVNMSDISRYATIYDNINGNIRRWQNLLL